MKPIATENKIKFTKNIILTLQLNTKVIENGMWLHKQLAEAENEKIKFTFIDIGGAFVIDKKIKNEENWLSFAIDKKELFQKLIDAIENGEKNESTTKTMST